MEEKQPGRFRSILLKIIIPLVLTIIAGAFLLNFVGFPVWKSIQNWGNSVPVLSAVIPDPKEEKNQSAPNEWEQKFLASSAELKQKEDEIKSLNKKVDSLESNLDDLKVENAKLQKEQTTIKSQSFQDQIKQIADVYSNMPESKAAAILSSMNIEDSCFTLSVLDTNLQSSILSSMKDVKQAAQLSTLLSQIVVADQQDAPELKQQIQQLIQQRDSQTNTLADTISGMPAAQSAGIIQSMMQTNAQVALTLLKNVPTSNRSQILAEIAKTDPKTAAQITASLN